MMFNRKKIERLEFKVKHLENELKWREREIEDLKKDKKSYRDKVHEQSITIKHHEARIEELQSKLCDLMDNKEALIKQMAKLILEEQDDTNYNNLVEQIRNALRVNQ